MEAQIKPHTERILKQVIYKYILDEEQPIAARSLKICELIGLFVPADFMIPTIVRHLTDTESKNVPRFVSSCLTALSAVITYSGVRFADQFDGLIDKLLTLITTSDYLQSENVEVLDRTLRVTHNIVFAAGKQSCKSRQRVLFKLLLQLGSTPQLINAKVQVDQTLELLAKNCDLQDASDLFSCELEGLLLEMKDDFENWNRNTSERFIFDMLVRRADTAVVDYWDQILEIIAANVDPDTKDYELRLDMLSLIEHLLLQPNLQSTIAFYTEIIIKLILLPSTEWRAGIPNLSIRKGAVICLLKLLE